jgi:serine/threonine protein kinase
VPTRPARPVRSAGPEVAPPAAPTPSPTPPGDLPPGTRLGGRYVIEGRLGHGGFASVYRARQDNLGRPVAIKVLRPHPSVPLDSQRARLQREAEALSRLSAPGCVRIYDVGELPDGRPWIAQEFVAGTRLDIALKSGPFTTARAIEVAAGVLLALAEAHAHGVVHRDIKPDNIMLVVGADGRERVKVLDFGIARLQGPTDAQSFRTSTRHVFGTPQYMAPEQARQEPLGPAADLYAVGILLHRMLVGREPFDGPDGYGILRAQVYDTVPRPAGVPAPVVDVMMQALAKRPKASGTRKTEAGQPLALLHFFGLRACERLRSPQRGAERARNKKASGTRKTEAGQPLALLHFFGFASSWMTRSAREWRLGSGSLARHSSQWVSASRVRPRLGKMAHRRW